MANTYKTLGSKNYSLVVEVKQCNENGKTFVNYTLKCGKYDVALSLRNYDSLVHQVVIDETLKK